MLRQHAQQHSSTSERFPSFLCDIPHSLLPSSGIETSVTVHSDPGSAHYFPYQEAVYSLSASKTSEISYRSLDKNSRPPALGPYHYQLRPDNQRNIHPRKDLR